MTLISHSMMEEPEWRHKATESVDINDLLNNGYWKTSRTKSSSSTASPTTSPRSSFLGPTTPSTHSRPRYIPRSDWPPSPSCEDEPISLARELSTTTSEDSVDEIPCRGRSDQHPILYPLHEEKDGVLVEEKEPPKNVNPERRFVLQSHSSSESDDENSAAERARKRSHRKSRHEENDGHRKHDDSKLSDKNVPLARKPSRQDLPNLDTKIEPPPFHRSPSSYSFIPPKEEARHSVRTPDTSSSRKTSEYSSRSPDTPRTDDRKPVRTPKGETYLSPDTPRDELKHVRTPKGETYHSPDTPRDELKHVRTPKSETVHFPDTSRREESKHARTPKTETFLSPDGGRNQPGYFDIVGSRHSSRSDHSTPRPRTPSDKPKSPSEATRRPEALRSPSSRVPHRPEVDDMRRERSGHHTSSEDERKVRHRHHHRNKSSTLHPDSGRDSGRDGERHHRSHSHSRSGYTSPLISPKASPKVPQGRHETYPPPRRTASSDSDHSDPLESARLRPSDIWDRPARKPSPVPGVDYEYVESIPPDVKAPLKPDSPPPPSFWQPSSKTKPMGTYRRYSEDIENGVIPSVLPVCPRKDFVEGYNDWYTIPGCPEVDICPTCYSAVAETPYRHQFVLAPHRPLHNRIRCDFGSSIWHRIAWLLTTREHRPDVSLLKQVAKILSSHEKCTSSKPKQWYSIPDPTTALPMPGFSVCGACVGAMTAILPPLRPLFTRIDNPTPRPCAMRYDSRKFVLYFDAFEMFVNGSLPSTLALAHAVKDIARQPECFGDTLLFEEWYSITQLPEFTCCQECFEEVVKPLQARRKAIALMVGRREAGWGRCLLHGERMRRGFRECVEGDRYMPLVVAVREETRK